MKTHKGIVLLLILLCACSFVSAQVPLGHLTTLQEGKTRRISSAHADRSKNWDNRRILPGEKLVLADIKGSGSIRHIWMTFPGSEPGWLGKDGCADHSELVIRMYWDGATEPSVESPVGDFFAAGFGQRAEVNSVPIVVEEGDSYNSFWIMPFYSSARIEIVNQGDKPSNSFYFQVDYQIEENHTLNTPYFCAQYRQEFPCASGKDYLILDAEGKGHYVGTVLSGRSRSPEWFGEGDEKFYIDGDKRPTIQGTGTEDYALHAWGFNRPTSYGYFGVPVLEGEWGTVGWYITLYRWHIVEPISFDKSLRVEIEDAGWISEDELAKGETIGHVERNDDFASVAFWYQVGHPKRYASLPTALERKLPEIDLIIQGKDLLKSATCSDTYALSLQAGYSWTGDGQLFCAGNKSSEMVGQWLSCDFIVQKKELRQLSLRMTKADDFGIYNIYVDGELKREWVDFYSPYVKVVDITLGQYTLPEGKHTIRFECVGKRGESKAAHLGFDSVRLRQRWDVKRKAPADYY